MTSKQGRYVKADAYTSKQESVRAMQMPHTKWAKLTEAELRDLVDSLEHQLRHDVRCLDCSRPYPHGLDMVLTLKQWKMIHPDSGGVLCPSCIVNRASHLEGCLSVYAHIVTTADVKSEDPLEAIIEALRLENADYCAATGELQHEKELLEQQLLALNKVAGLEQEAKTEESQHGFESFLKKNDHLNPEGYVAMYALDAFNLGQKLYRNERIAELEAQVTRLSAPVSDKEWAKFGYTVTTDASSGPISEYSRINSTTRYCTVRDVETLIRSRATQEQPK